MASFGKHPLLTFVNGSTTEPLDADNMNEIERVIENCDNELARSNDFKFSSYKEYFYQRNVKEISYFDDYTLWTAEASTTKSSDVSNGFIGAEATKAAESDSTSSYCGINRTLSSTLDLTKFNDGSASDTSDNIVYSFYISDYTKVDFIGIELGTDSSNYYYVAYASTNWSRNGNVVLFPRKSAFSVGAGSPSWSTINWVRVYFHTTASASGEYVTSQLLSMYRQDYSNPGYYNPFQTYKGLTSGWENTLENNVSGWLLYKDTITHTINSIFGNWYSFSGNETLLHIYCDVISFVFSGEFVCKAANEGQSVTWYNNSSNYIEAYIQADTLTLDVHEGGVLAQTTVSFDTNLEFNDVYNLRLEKDLQTIRAIVTKGYEDISICEYETSISAAAGGCVYLGHYGSSGESIINDFYISANPNKLLDTWERPFIKIKRENENLISTTMQADNELEMALPPNEIFQIDLCLLASSSSDVPDIKVDIAMFGDYTQLSGRYTTSAPVGVSSILDTNIKFGYWSALDFDGTYGIDNTGNESIIQERFFIASGVNGCGVTVRWSQNTTSATAITVGAGSYLKATKITRM